MNDIIFSQFSELTSDQVADFLLSRSPDSSASSSSQRSKKHTQTTTETWAHAKKLKLDELVQHDHAGNRIWVCDKCSWESAFLTSAQNHLDQRHDVKINM